MKEVMNFNGYDITFEMKYYAPDVIHVLANEYVILEISPKGLTRYNSVNCDGIKVDLYHRIKFSSDHHPEDTQLKTTGKKDVVLKFIKCGNELYINNHDSYLCKFTNHGLYLWIDHNHKEYCYATSKADTILLLE